MNFNKYHVSKNLWDSGDVTVALHERYKSIPVSLEQGAYTLSFEYESENTSTVTVIFYNESTAIQAFNVTITNGKGNVSITSEQPITIIRLYSAAGYTPSYNYAAEYTKIMLNVGSTPLPYEPYSSEVWHDTPHYIHNTSTDTITTPADIYANDTTATVGLKGNMEQTGTPTSTTPIQPSECGEKTAQLFEDKIDGCSIDTNGILIGNSSFDMYIAKVEQGVTYTASASITGGFYTTKPIVGSASYNGQRMVFANATVTAPITGYLAFRVNAGGTAMLNTGSTALPYEPYGYKLTISSANTTTPVYLGEVQSTRKIKKLVLDGTESDWYKASTANVFINYSIVSDCYNPSDIITVMCTHYDGQVNANGVSGVSDLKCCFRTTAPTLYIGDNNYTDINDFTTYLAQQYANGTPVTVWYVLSSATTGIVNEPIRKIGNYADTVSGITIPTITGKDSFDVQTTLKPSEVELTYTGWHDASVGEWDGSEWQ